MRIVFLDIDGVLVTRRSFFIRAGDLPSCEASCVAALNEICEATGAQIVVSSSWRLDTSLGDLKKILEEWGVKAPVLDVTPIGVRTRGAEIEEWMSAWANKGGTIESYVIVDDCPDVEGELLPHLVETKWNSGLSAADARKAIEILGSA